MTTNDTKSIEILAGLHAAQLLILRLRQTVVAHSIADGRLFRIGDHIANRIIEVEDAIIADGGTFISIEADLEQIANQ